MSNELLIENIKALLHLNASNSLVPHGIGNHARDLLDASITSIDRLRTEVAGLKEERDVFEAQRDAWKARSERRVDDIRELVARHEKQVDALTQQLAAANAHAAHSSLPEADKEKS